MWNGVLRKELGIEKFNRFMGTDRCLMLLGGLRFPVLAEGELKQN